MRARARARQFLQARYSALAAPTVRGDEATGLDLGDSGAAAGTRLPTLVMNGEKVPDLFLECGREPRPKHLDRIGEGRSGCLSGLDLAPLCRLSSYVVLSMLGQSSQGRLERGYLATAVSSSKT